MKWQLYIWLIGCFITNTQIKAQNIKLYGCVTDSNSPLQSVVVKIQNTNYNTYSNRKGMFELIIPFQKKTTINFSLLGYQKQSKIIVLNQYQDSLRVNIELIKSFISIEEVNIYANKKPDTLVGSPKFSIYDFDFYEDKFILLTSAKGMDKAELKLADVNGKIITSYPVPKDAGEAKELYHDYMGYTNLICENYVYRINFYIERFVLIPLNPKDVDEYIKPIIDTVDGKIIFTDYWKLYPAFNYYSYNETDSSKHHLISIENKELMHAYNFEYYNLKPREKLEARRLAEEYNTDKRIIASLMSGFTKSLFYEPPFAPLYIINDTISVFDHYKDYLFHLNSKGQFIDSVKISYNHPKNWQEWKHQMLKDELENKVYAVYAKSGRKYIKQICYRTGKELGRYNLQFHSADKLKIRDGYAYYIYRPFESTQEKYFYRELINLEKTN